MTAEQQGLDIGVEALARLQAESTALGRGQAIVDEVEDLGEKMRESMLRTKEAEIARQWRQVDLNHQVHVERTRREARRLVDAEEQPDPGDLDALFLNRDQLDDLPQPEALIPGVLPRHAYGVLRGRDQSFKSFVALDWSLTLASGVFWNMTPVERVPVLYIAGEGAWGLRQRLAAWEERRHQRVDPDWFTVRQVALNLHRPGPAFEHLLEHVERRAYGLVVVDTLRRVSGAADGNGSEMGAVVDNLDRIKHATAGGTVLVVAHTDKGDNDSRGYSGIEDDADFVWHAQRDGLDLDLELTKMKDGPDGLHVYMRAWPVEGSLVLSPTTRTDDSESKRTESEDAVLLTLQQTFPDGAYSGALRDACELPKSTFHRALAGLVRQGKVLKTGSHQRPFYEPAGLTSPAAVSPDIDAQVSSVPPESQRVPRVSRPLGSETDETPVESETANDEASALIARLTDDDEGASE